MKTPVSVLWYHDGMKLSELTPDENNANKGTERGSGMIEGSLSELGAGRSILLDKNGRIIAGNKTALAAESVGIEKVVVVETTGDEIVAVMRTDLDLDDATGKARQLAYADNRTSQVSMEFDPEVLAADLEAGLDLSNWFDDFELEDIGATVPDFLPTGDVQPQLDSIKPVSCPSCGEVFIL